MIKISKLKLFLSIIVTIFGLAFALPNFKEIKNDSFFPNKGINLGLDLRGGSHLLLEIDLEKYLYEQMVSFGDNLKKSLINNKLGYKNFKFTPDSLSFQLRNSSDFEKIKSLVRKLDSYTIIKIINPEDNIISVTFDESRISQMTNDVFNQSIEVIRMRVDSTGTKEPNIQKQGDRFILLQVPGEENPENLKNILGQTAKLTFHLVNEDASLNFTGKPPRGYVFIKPKDDSEYGVFIEKKPSLSGDRLKNAQSLIDDKTGNPVIAFQFDNQGAKIFSDLTKKNIRKRFAIVLDNKLLCAPTINDHIPNGNGQISGNYTLEKAEELALLLRSGALPADLKIVEERSIGPNLGADSIEAGKKAGLIGFIGVIIFMGWSYGVFGIFANIALVLALIYIVAMLSMLQATLTLPGIAGIILTIGMAVDANVLIYERIREEIKNSKNSLIYAIKQGFDTAFATILDSNITTLIAALFLYIFGTGAIKGFAVTLTIGIIASMFSAIVITKIQIDIWMKLVKPQKINL